MPSLEEEEDLDAYLDVSHAFHTLSESEGEEDYDEDITASLTSEMEEGIDEEEEVQLPPPPKRKRQRNALQVEAIPTVAKAPVKRRGPRPQLAAANGKTAQTAAPPPRATAAAAAGRKRKQPALPTSSAFGDDGPAAKMEKWDPPKITTSNVTIRDFSQPLVKFNTDKFILGSRHTAQVGNVKFGGSRSYGYEALILSREPSTDKDADSNQKKPFRFTMPSNLIRALFNTLAEILGESPNQSALTFDE